MKNPIAEATFDAFRSQMDYFVIGGDRSPGAASLKSCESKRSFDIRKAYGTAGATAIYTGDELAVPIFELSLWDAQGVSDWLLFAKKYLGKPPRGIAPSSIFALDIQYPTLACDPINVRSVQVLVVTALQQDEFGLFTCEIHFLEYRRPLPALAKPDASIPATDGFLTTIPTAIEAGDLALERARAERDAAGAAYAAAVIK
ncbi:MAG: uncharacterized protein JWM74_229 [Myxococcaceae bacterium]|nr:uncharacterized protein [Myxococcaceae bacterium]